MDNVAAVVTVFERVVRTFGYLYRIERTERTVLPGALAQCGENGYRVSPASV